MVKSLISWNGRRLAVRTTDIPFTTTTAWRSSGLSVDKSLTTLSLLGQKRPHHVQLPADHERCRRRAFFGDGFSTTPAFIALATIFFLPGQLQLSLEAWSVEFEDLTKPLFDGFQMFGRHLPYPPIESLLRQRAYLIDNCGDGTPRAFHGDQYWGEQLEERSKAELQPPFDGVD